MTSIESPNDSLQTKWVKAIGKLQALPRILTIQSLKRNMRHEDDLARRDAEAYHRVLHGGRGDSQGEADEMGDNIYLGDYHVEQSIPESPKSNGLAKALLGAGLIATGAGAQYAIPLLLEGVSSRSEQSQQPSPPEQKTETKTNVIDWEVGEPIVE